MFHNRLTLRCDASRTGVDDRSASTIALTRSQQEGTSDVNVTSYPGIVSWIHLLSPPQFLSDLRALFPKATQAPTKYGRGFLQARRWVASKVRQVQERPQGFRLA